MGAQSDTDCYGLNRFRHYLSVRELVLIKVALGSRQVSPFNKVKIQEVYWRFGGPKMDPRNCISLAGSLRLV